jgi:hypothetical protein
MTMTRQPTRVLHTRAPAVPHRRLSFCLGVLLLVIGGRLSAADPSVVTGLQRCTASGDHGDPNMTTLLTRDREDEDRRRQGKVPIVE